MSFASLYLRSGAEKRSTEADPALPHKAARHVCPEPGGVLHGALVEALVVAAGVDARARPVVHMHALWRVMFDSLREQLPAVAADVKHAETRFLVELGIHTFLHTILTGR